MNWLIFIQKKMPEKCLLRIELLLFLSLKMKLWHITDTRLDFANIPALTHAHLMEQLLCSAASSTCALQRSRAQRALGSCSCPSITPAGSAHPAAPQTPGSCLSGCQPELCRQREQVHLNFKTRNHPMTQGQGEGKESPSLELENAANNLISCLISGSVLAI